jgi:hypothetical protein
MGFDSGDYSFPYVARWAGGSEDLIKDTASRVIACAKSILGCLVVPSEEDKDMEKAS